MTDNFWAEEMQAKLGKIPAVKLLQEAQEAGQRSGKNVMASSQDEFASLNELKDEVAELDEAVRERQGAMRIRHEVGDIIFNLVSICRQNGVDFNEAIEKTAYRWLNRKALHERKVRSAGYDWSSVPFELKEQLWREAKRELKKQEESI